MRVVVDNYYYRIGTTVPVMFDIPFRLDSIVTKAIVRFGTIITKRHRSKITIRVIPRFFGKWQDG